MAAAEPFRGHDAVCLPDEPDPALALGRIAMRISRKLPLAAAVLTLLSIGAASAVSLVVSAETVTDQVM